MPIQKRLRLVQVARISVMSVMDLFGAMNPYLALVMGFRASLCPSSLMRGCPSLHGLDWWQRERHGIVIFTPRERFSDEFCRPPTRWCLGLPYPSEGLRRNGEWGVDTRLWGCRQGNRFVATLPRRISRTLSRENLGTVRFELPPACRVRTGNWDAETAGT
jgi:hypothetical protein